MARAKSLRVGRFTPPIATDIRSAPTRPEVLAELKLGESGLFLEDNITSNVDLPFEDGDYRSRDASDDLE
ncbi:MAG: hypothetical protein AAGG44_17880 [Planctomycetota bacterium]